MSHEELHARVAKLEGWNRLLFGCIVLGTLAAGLTGAAPERKPLPDGEFRIVRAGKFAVVDPRTGITRATLSHQVAPNGWAGLHFYDNAGHPRVWIQVFEDGEASIAMLDNEGRLQSEIGIDNMGLASSAMNQNEKYDYKAEMKRKGVDLTYSGNK